MDPFDRVSASLRREASQVELLPPSTIAELAQRRKRVRYALGLTLGLLVAGGVVAGAISLSGGSPGVDTASTGDSSSAAPTTPQSSTVPTDLPSSPSETGVSATATTSGASSELLASLLTADDMRAATGSKWIVGQEGGEWLYPELMRGCVPGNPMIVEESRESASRLLSLYGTGEAVGENESVLLVFARYESDRDLTRAWEELTNRFDDCGQGSETFAFDEISPEEFAVSAVDHDGQATEVDAQFAVRRTGLNIGLVYHSDPHASQLDTRLFDEVRAKHWDQLSALDAR